MALPSHLQTTTVTGTYTEFDGTPCFGSVTFTPKCTCFIVDGPSGAIITGSITAKLDDQGRIEVELPTAGQPDVTPPDFCFEVTEETSCLGCARTYTISTACPEGEESPCTLDLSNVLNTT